MKDKWILLGFAILKLLLTLYLIHPVYDLHRDEFLHLDQAHHLAWGYQSVPPFTSWVSYIIYQLGNGVFWVKFFPTFFGILTLMVVWKTIDLLKGSFYAKILAAIAILFSVITRLNLLYQPNSLDVLAWTTVYFGLIAYFKTGHKKWIYFTAIVFALGILNKYNIAFLLLGLLPALLLTKQRKIFAQTDLYLAILIGILLISPNLWWQYQNGFPVIGHMRELAETQLVNVSVSGFLNSQFFYFIGSILVLLAGIISLFIYPPFKNYRFLGTSLLFTLMLFIYFKAKGYYAIGIYPIYLAFGAVYLDHLFQKKWTLGFRTITLAIPIILFIPILDISYPNKTPEYIVANQEKYRTMGMLKWEDGKEYAIPQDYADMLGWKELAAIVDSAFDRMPKDQPIIVLADNYGEAGAINYYSKKEYKVVSFNADYINWIDLSKSYKHVLRIVEPHKVEEEITSIKEYFEQYIIMGAIQHPYAREKGTTVIAFMGAKIDLNKIIVEEINEKLDRFK